MDPMPEIERGYAVLTEDNKRAGDVVEVHAHYLLISRGLLRVRDTFVPRYAVASVEDHTVRLAITDERLRQMDWRTPPPPPPPLDRSRAVPRLVPTPESDLPDGAGDETDEAAPLPLSDQPSRDANAAADADADASPFPYDFGALTMVPDDYQDMGILLGPTIDVDGEVYLAVQQAGHGPAVVLVHGWGFDRRIWDTLLLDLPRHHTVITIDSRGYGRSTAPWYGYNVERTARDLRVILRTLDVQDATVVALDIGAAAALRYVRDGGRRAGRLVLIAPVFGLDPLPMDTEPLAATADGDAPAPDQQGEPVALPVPFASWVDEMRADRPRLAARLAALWAPWASPDLQGWLRDGLLTAAPYALLHGLETLARSVHPAALGDLALPVTVLHSPSDPVVPFAGVRDAVAAAGDGVHLVELAGSGHLPMLSDAAAVLRAISPPAEDASGDQGDLPA